MSFAGGFDSSDAWAPPQAGDIIAEAMKKEKVLKELAASQEDLRALYGRVQSVQKEVEKLTSGNATLQMYIDNLTVQMAKRR
ncbi:hypothetical protein Moror_13957 [Moniliophthora roreri MCA 2997]|uniref:Uncharacterized protein n=1 Tax=Moniliophthora roreri (strain MCA 2997) TaxID=1381753 RepID=V2XMH8_MONRO|nr:hypothetical protein Moror_13957 [Moniliophthora roreri MCA 2997]